MLSLKERKYYHILTPDNKYSITDFEVVNKKERKYERKKERVITEFEVINKTDRQKERKKERKDNN